MVIQVGGRGERTHIVLQSCQLQRHGALAEHMERCVRVRRWFSSCAACMVCAVKPVVSSQAGDQDPRREAMFARGHHRQRVMNGGWRSAVRHPILVREVWVDMVSKARKALDRKPASHTADRAISLMSLVSCALENLSSKSGARITPRVVRSKLG